MKTECEDWVWRLSVKTKYEDWVWRLSVRTECEDWVWTLWSFENLLRDWSEYYADLAWLTYNKSVHLFWAQVTYNDKLSELNTEMSSFWNFDYGNTWICELTGWPELLDDGRLLRQCSLWDSSFPMFQIPKGKYLCVQVTGPIILKPEPKKGRTLIDSSIVFTKCNF